MTRRFWRIALIALAGTIIVAVVMAVAYREIAIDNLKEMRAEQNVELARSMSNSLGEDVRRLIDVAAVSSWVEMQQSPVVAEVAQSIGEKVDNLPVVRVNIFAPDGLTLYSTESERIGARVMENPGIEVAAAGREISRIVRRNSLNEFDRVIEQQDMIESYVPLRDQTGKVIGVFEIHSNISPLISRISATGANIVLGVFGIMSVFYLLLVYLLRRMDLQLVTERTAGKIRSTSLVYEKGEELTASKFVATISHEIRTPLNAVLGMTDLLNLTGLTRKQRRYIQSIQSSGDMLLTLVDNLLDFSDLELGALRLQEGEFDVVDLFEGVMQVMRYDAYSKDIELVGNIRHDLDLRVLADKRRLRQILVNLVGNAIKFTDRGEVCIDVTADLGSDDDVMLKFSVMDTGIGIDDNTRDRLFDAFDSSARPDSTQSYGNGLGLTICKQLIENMNGQIDIGSREGGGTTVCFAVPVKQVRPAIANDLKGGRNDWPQRVLSIQGNRSVAECIGAYLGRWDIPCETLHEADEGIHRLRAAASGNKPFGCAIIDASLTKVDKLLLVRRIRNSPEISDLPVILLTSITEPLEVGEVSALGGVRCINKPLLPLELRYKLLRLVQEDGAPEQAESISKELAGDTGAVTILIAEDNPVSSGVLQGMLQSAGYAADVVDNGPAVLEALRKKDYELLLLDCQMPGMDGDRVTLEIRRHPDVYNSNAVIVAITADTTERHRAQCLEAGMDDFVPKPVRLDDLRSRLAKWSAMAAARGNSDANSAPRELRRNLVERTGHDDDSFLSNYISLFIQDAESRLIRINDAMESHDPTAVRREGHALKGSCLELGADRMARYCEDLSAAARSENRREAELVIQKLGREFMRLRPVYESAKRQTH